MIPTRQDCPALREAQEIFLAQQQCCPPQGSFVRFPGFQGHKVLNPPGDHSPGPSFLKSPQGPQGLRITKSETGQGSPIESIPGPPLWVTSLLRNRGCCGQSPLLAPRPSSPDEPVKQKSPHPGSSNAPSCTGTGKARKMVTQCWHALPKDSIRQVYSATDLSSYLASQRMQISCPHTGKRKQATESRLRCTSHWLPAGVAGL